MENVLTAAERTALDQENRDRRARGQADLLYPSSMDQATRDSVNRDRAAAGLPPLPQSPTGQDWSTLDQATRDSVNRDRAAKGLQPLPVDPRTFDQETRDAVNRDRVARGLTPLSQTPFGGSGYPQDQATIERGVSGLPQQAASPFPQPTFDSAGNPAAWPSMDQETRDAVNRDRATRNLAPLSQNRADWPAMDQVTRDVIHRDRMTRGVSPLASVPFRANVSGELTYPWATAMQALAGLQVVYACVTGDKTITNEQAANGALAAQSYGMSLGFRASGNPVASPVPDFRAHYEMHVAHLANLQTNSGRDYPVESVERSVQGQFGAQPNALGDGTFLKGLPWASLLQILAQLLGTFAGK